MRSGTARIGSRPGVSHLQRCVPERFRVRHPRQAPVGTIAEAGQRRLETLRIFFERQTAHQMRLLRRIAEIVVEAARAGIGPPNDALNRRHAARPHWQRPTLRRSGRRSQPLLFSGVSKLSSVAPRSTAIARYRSTLSCCGCSETAPRRAHTRAAAIPAPV